MRLSELQCNAGNIAYSKGWNKPGLDDRYFLNRIMEECGEAIQEIGNERGNWYFSFGSSKPEGLLAELADIVILCSSFAHYKGLDLEGAIKRKLEYNLTRHE